MSNIESRALKLVAAVYEAALNAGYWSHAIELVADEIGASGGALRHMQLPSLTLVNMSALGYDECWVRAYRQHFVALDPFHRHFDAFPIAELGRSDMLVNWREYRKSEWYNDFAKPQDKIHMVGSTIARGSGGRVQIMFQRGRQAGPFADDDLRLLKRVVPHISRAVNMQFRLCDARRYETMVCAALDRLRVGAILTDSAARPFFVNRAAEGLQGYCGLRLGPGAIELEDSANTGRLQGMIAAAALTSMGANLDGEGEASFETETGALHVSVVPVASELLALEVTAPAACAAVFVSKRCCDTSPWRRLAVQHQLTPAETRLARALAEGLCVKEIAERYLISRNTVRTQIRSIFDKTGARRQAQLVRLLSNDFRGGIRKW
ncbi:hypothetical protein BURK2_02523 [Burkholderiales bacterium]|nr:hypothetical protein BURK2_02523 [Burkholderiales bacterium]